MLSHPLHVALYTNAYKPVVNGVAISVEGFRDTLLGKGHQVYVLCPESQEPFRPDRFVIRYPAFELPVQKYPIAVPVSPFADQFIETSMPDVLHAHHPALLGRAAVQHAERYSLPLVFTYHTRYHDYAHYAEPFPKDRVKEFITHWLAHFMAHCHHIVVPSESIRELVAETYGINDLVSVVPTGISQDRFQPTDGAESRKKLGWKPEETVFVSSGRLSKEKNFELLLEAASKLPQERPWKLFILGEGDHKDTLKKTRDKLELTERVEFLGLIPFDQIPTYLAAADVFCFASVTETQGLVTLEAMAMETAVVAVDASGTRDVIESGTDGLLTEVDAGELGKAMTRLLKAPELRQKLASAALLKAAQYSMDKQTDKLLDVYRSAMEAQRIGKRVVPETHTHWETFLSLLRRSEEA